MTSTKLIRNDLKNLNFDFNNNQKEITNNMNLINQLRNRKSNYISWARNTLKFQGGRYIDPYSGKDRTDEYNKEIKNIDNQLLTLWKKVQQLKSQQLILKNNIKKTSSQYQQLKKANRQQARNRIMGIGGKLKSVPQRLFQNIANTIKSIPGATMQTFNEIKDFFKLGSYGVSMTDHLFNKDLVNQTKNIMNGNHNFMSDQPSKLGGEVLFDRNGNPTEYYDHYNKYTNTADIDLKTPHIYYTNTQNGITQQKVSNVTVFLNENGQPDFSRPENSRVLNNSKILTQIIEQYPMCLETIPASHLVDVSPDVRKEIATAYNNGIQDRQQRGDYGFNNDGTFKEEADFLNEAQDLFNKKSAEATKLKNARQNMQGQQFGF